MSDRASWSRRFAVRGIIWRQYLDWGVENLPFYFVPFLMWFWTTFFFFFATPARRAVLLNLKKILPGSWQLMNYLRVWRTLYNFAWTLTDAADFKLHRLRFSYELIGAELLDQLAATRGAIVLTAHMGNYDLGAAIFAQKFNRELRMVRAPEPDRQTAKHVDQSLERAGGVRVDYNVAGTMLSFDLLSALRQGEIVSIQGDRVEGGLAQSRAELFGHDVALPTGPFILSLVAQAPIFPFFIVRSRYRTYRFIARAPIIPVRDERGREEAISAALQQWCRVLEEVISSHWDQWFAFHPPFQNEGT